MKAQAGSSSVSIDGIFYPPGGLMVWMLILLELLTFGAAFCIYSFQMADEPAVFASSQSLLNVPLATVNTIILITSGFFAALGVASFKQGKNKISSRWLNSAALLGAGFAGLKFFEYRAKLGEGLEMSKNTFFGYYWALTGFHLLHVLIGIPILLWCAQRARSGKPFEDPDVTLETGVAFWHMCDLIWVMLFPLIYLAH